MFQVENLLKNGLLIIALMGLSACEGGFVPSEEILPSLTPPDTTPTPTPTPDEEDPPGDAVMGARAVPRSKDPAPTDHFVSPDGSGNDCSETNPCELQNGLNRGQGGYVWMLSGTYDFSGQINVQDGTTLEAVEPKQAIIDFGGTEESRLVAKNNTVIRNIIVRNSSGAGVSTFGDNNLFEGVISEYNYGSGFTAFPTSQYDDLINPTGGSFNTWKDSIARYNSDESFKCGGTPPCTDSDADGWSISAGRGNKIIHCEAIGNSDDGIDVWRSYETTVEYSIARGGGRHPDDPDLQVGNGNGFKMGSSIGPVPNNHKFTNNWAYDNISQDFSINGGQGFLEVEDNVCGDDQTDC